MLKICDECVNEDHEYCNPDIGRSSISTHVCSGFKQKPVYVWINIYKRSSETPESYIVGETLHKSEEAALKMSQNAVVKGHKIKIKG